MKEKKNIYNDDILRQSYYVGMPKKERRALYLFFNAYRETNKVFLTKTEKSELLTLIWDNENNCLPQVKLDRLNILSRGDKNRAD